MLRCQRLFCSQNEGSSQDETEVMGATSTLSLQSITKNLPQLALAPVLTFFE